MSLNQPHPDDEADLLKQAMATHQAGRLDEAERLYRKLLSTNQKLVEAWTFLGVVLLQRGQPAEALRHLDRSLSITPAQPYALVKRGNALRELNRHQDALAAYDMALALQPNDVEAHHGSGVALKALNRFEDAVACYDKVLALLPDSAEAYYNRGNAKNELGHYSEALDDFDHALKRKPDFAHAHNNRGIALKELERYEDAVTSYDRALALKPDFAEAHTNRGHALKELQRFEDALAAYDNGLMLAPDLAISHFNRGNLLRTLKRTDEALASYDEALRCDPNSAEAHTNLGGAFMELKQYQAALVSFDRVLELKPEHAKAFFNRANALRGLGRHEEALASYDGVLALNSDFADAYCGRGDTLRELKRSEEALASYDRALSLNSELAEAHCGRGNLLRDLRRFPEALAAYRRTIEIKPDYARGFIALGNMFRELGRHGRALDGFRRALELNPDADYLFGNFLYAKMKLCDWDGIDADFARILRLVEDGKMATAPFVLLAMPSTLSHQLETTRSHVLEHNAATPAPLWTGETYDHPRLRLGYFSADFRNHPTAHLIAGLFECHDRSAFEVVGFSWGRPAEGAMRQRLEAGLDRLIDVHAMSDREIAKRVRDMEIDIAIDLMGHTKSARMGIFAHRPAPVQVGYLGYPGTTGSAHIDYLIADPTVVPDVHRQYYSEKIVTLPHSYQPNDRKRAIAERLFTRAELGLPELGFVFCCFNNNYKITPDVFDIWMRLLHAVEGSVLWLLGDNPGTIENLAGEAQRRGVAPERLVFAKKLALPEHLARHRAADLFLDTFYYNAHTTASDALWAGLPVVTRLGETFASRVAASVLRAAGLPDLVTESDEDYEALALALATDGARLSAIKERLHNNRDNCALFDTALTTRHLEAAFRLLHERQRAKLAPDHILVPNAARSNGNLIP